MEHTLLIYARELSTKTALADTLALAANADNSSPLKALNDTC